MKDLAPHEQLIIKSIDEVKADTKSILLVLNEQGREIDRLKFKSGLWGIIGGVLSTFGVKLGTLIDFH